MTKDVEARAREILLNACRAVNAGKSAPQPYGHVVAKIYRDACETTVSDDYPGDALIYHDRALNVVALLLEAAVAADPEQ